MASGYLPIGTDPRMRPVLESVATAFRPEQVESSTP